MENRCAALAHLGASWVRPVTHPMVHVTSSQVADHVRLVIQERDYRDHAPDAETSSVVDGCDRLEVTIGPNAIRFTAGIGGIAPLYLAMADGIVYGSWHLPDLRRHARTGRLLDRAEARVLTRRLRYSSDTLFRDIVMVTERATAIATPTGITINRSPGAHHVIAARHPRAGTKVVEAFETLLASAVSRVVPPGMRIGIELSGGVDSPTGSPRRVPATHCVRQPDKPGTNCHGAHHLRSRHRHRMFACR